MLTDKAFDSLMGYLGPDEQSAGRRYEEIRQRLIRLFQWRGSLDPEELADETINRVALKLASGVEIRSEDPFRYFCGVAHLVFKEILRRQKRERTMMEEVRQTPEAVPEDSEDPRMDWLRQCLDQMTPENRRLMIEYNQGEKGQRIRHRKRLAGELGIQINALRIRIHRLRSRLESCVKERAAAS
ncbi:MAG: hypothetical protein AAF604_19520 [Acidobacteriota bacterium]